MPAITFKSTLINLSYTSDALTLYPTFAYYHIKELRNCLTVIQLACNEFDYVIKVTDKSSCTITNKKFVAILETLRDGNAGYAGFEAFVRKGDQDHLLYHDDEFKSTDSHWHIKFNCLLNLKKIDSVLLLIVKHGLLTLEERSQFLSTIKNYFKSARAILATLIPPGKNKEADSKGIIRFIRSCRNNEALRDIHNYLLLPEFDYLRATSVKDREERYLGSNLLGAIIYTSRVWCLLEKCIAAQIAYNIQQIGHFTQRLGACQAEKYAKTLCFFALPMTASSAAHKDSIYNALREGNCTDITHTRMRLLAKL